MDKNVDSDFYPYSKSLIQRGLLAVSCVPRDFRIEAANILDRFFTDKIRHRLSNDSLEFLLVVSSFLKGNSHAYTIQESATALRFWLTRLLFEPGEHKVTVGNKLFSRPWNEIQSLADQVGATLEAKENGFIVFRKEFSDSNKSIHLLDVPTKTTSHFASAIAIVSALQKQGPRAFQVANDFESRSFFELTLDQIESWSLSADSKTLGDFNRIEFSQAPHWNTALLDKILKSCLELDAGAVFFDQLYKANRAKRINHLLPLNTFGLEHSHQPDAFGFQILNTNSSTKELLVDLAQVPDLFPVLSVYCAHHFEQTKFDNIQRLSTKESNRIQKTLELLNAIGCTFEFNENKNQLILRKLKIEPHNTSVVFDTANDHRMVMAALLANSFGHSIEPLDLYSIQKSFPQFLLQKIKPVFIIGHRGTGKSTFVSQTYKNNPLYISADLDKEIEIRHNDSILNIFSSLGEEGFRELELKTAIEIIESCFLHTPARQVFVVLGAGFCKWEQLARFYPNAEYIWIQRESDLQERFFLNRPSLSNYTQRILEREKNFKTIATETHLLEEGFDTLAALNTDKPFSDYFYTAQSSDLRNNKINSELLELIQGGLKGIELRSDILNRDQMIQFLSQVPLSVSILLSQRTDQFEIDFPIDHNYEIDRDFVYLNKSNENKTNIVSYHGESLNEAIQCFGQFKHLPNLKFKLVLFTHKWSEVIQGYRWMSENFLNRVFLPATPINNPPSEALWKWFRLWIRSKKPFLNFLKKDRFSIADQPGISEVARYQKEFSFFAAVLGRPIAHSQSPKVHFEWSVNQGIPFFKIPLDRASADLAFEFLQKLGLKYAAVTSPLKEWAFFKANIHSARSKVFSVANSIAIDSRNNIHCDLTDKEGLLSLFDSVPELGEISTPEMCVVWGGGAMQKILKEILPKATFYSASLGAPRSGNPVSVSPKILIWACGSSQSAPLPDSFQPRVIIDLSYTDSSPGLALCHKLKVKPRYINGAKMFARQAALQRRFWESIS